MTLGALVNCLYPEDVLVTLDQDRTGAMHHPVLELDLVDGEHGALLPHVHVDLLEITEIRTSS